MKTYFRENGGTLSVLKSWMLFDKRPGYKQRQDSLGTVKTFYSWMLFDFDKRPGCKQRQDHSTPAAPHDASGPPYLA